MLFRNRALTFLPRMEKDARFWKKSEPTLNARSVDKTIGERAVMGQLLERETKCHKKCSEDIKAQPPMSKPALHKQTSPTWLLTAQTH